MSSETLQDAAATEGTGGGPRADHVRRSPDALLYAEGVIERFASLDRLLIVILVLALASTCLLVSAAEGGTKLGYRPWREGSVLHALVTLLAMNYQYPTRSGTEVKWLAQGLGSAGLILAVCAGWFVRTRREDEWGPKVSGGDAGMAGGGLRSRISLVRASQMTLLLLGIWAALSALWAPWPQAALGEAVRQLILIGGALALGRGLSHRAGPAAAGAMVAVLTVTSIGGLWHHYERSPVLRLEFPIGNPIFMAACLVPGMLLAAALLAACLRPDGDPVPQSVDIRSAVRARARRLWCAAGLTVCLAIMAWAFVLTGSRSPTVGLAAGMGAWAWMLGGKRLRRGAAAVTLVVLLAGGLWLYARPGPADSGRSASFRMRFYAWNYAVAMFLEQPLIGQGQAAYLLKSQEMSRSDAEHDAAAFVAELFGRAHNEWLEILAELGAVGLALAGTALGMAIWAAGSAVRRMADRRHRLCLAAAAASLVALVVEESADVALRKPGLPIVFHALLGLCWAMSRREPVPWTGREAGAGRLARVGGLAVGAAVSLGAIGVHLADWRGALAEMSAVSLGEKGDWSAALREADRASRYRLVTEDRLAAGYQFTRLALAGANRQLERLAGLVRAAQDARKIQPGLRSLAREDAANFREYFRAGAEAGTALLARMPAYPAVAELLADGWLALQSVESAERVLELRSEVGDYRPTAREWLRLEHAWFPFRARVALKLASLSEDRPVAERLDILRVALRGGPEPPSVQSSFDVALSRLMADQEFQTAAGRLLQEAHQACLEPDEQRWRDPYAPESLRLLASASLLAGRPDQAAAMARDAAALYDRPRFRRSFPGLRNRARVEFSRYALLARPDDPGEALEACREALADWPDSVAQEEWRAEARRELILLLLASGREEEAAAQLESGTARPSDAGAVDDWLGYGYSVLGRRFARLPAASRPAEVERWVQRAIELSPNSPDALDLAIRTALEAGREDEAAALLERLRGAVGSDAGLLAEIVQSLRNDFEQSQSLRFFADRLMGEFLQSESGPS